MNVVFHVCMVCYIPDIASICPSGANACLHLHVVCSSAWQETMMAYALGLARLMLCCGFSSNVYCLLNTYCSTAVDVVCMHQSAASHSHRSHVVNSGKCCLLCAYQVFPGVALSSLTRTDWASKSGNDLAQGNKVWPSFCKGDLGCSGLLASPAFILS